MGGSHGKPAPAEHWERIYASRSAREVGWYTPHLATSLEWIASLGLEPDAPIIDVGAGVSTLVDDLLALGHRDLTILDLSPNALTQLQSRISERSDEVNWLQGDVTEIELPADRYRLWHDRAVFHFLTEAEARTKYRDQLIAALEPGGYVIMGCFAPEAPPRCSGLPVQRYTDETLSEVLGNKFQLKHRQNEIHITPGGLEQAYLYCLFQLTYN